ncbi:hypothetical protein C8R46DRAFT_1160152 [Mycena filopes]|nr:hypothetical protein C8R46DRAFT_1160152 [Mycena filopes]
MESSIYWLPQPHQPETHPAHHSPPPQQDWQKQQPPQTQPGPASAPSTNPPHHQPTLDLSDFTTLGDLPGLSAAHLRKNPRSNPSPVASTSSTSAASPPPPQSSFYPFNAYYGTTSPYYNQWSSAPPSQSPDPIPLSNYSTLNGATTTNAAPSAQQQQPPQMMIDPALTTMNGTTSNGHNPYSQQPNYSTQPTTQQQQQQRQLAQYSYGSLPSFQMAYYLPQQQQQQQQPQGTLSPHALHAPATNSLMNAYYQPQPQASGSKQQQQSQQPPAPAPTLEQRRALLLTQIRPLLHPSQFSGAGAVSNLAQRLYDYGTADVDPATRLEILTKIRDGAGNHYFRAWAENQTAVDITREWLKAAFTASREGGEDAEALGETIMPLLHIIDRLPMSVESLKTSKLGKIVVKLVKDPPTPAIKDMAFNVERRWRQIVSETQPEPMVEDTKSSKKRKLADPPARAALPPLKKAATGSASGARSVVKKEAVPASLGSKAAAPAAKSDSSFFSAPKPKPKLPSFKKAPPAPPPSAAKKDDAGNVAQPSAIDPFQEVLKAMKTRKGSPLQVGSASSPHGSGGAEAAMASGSASSMPGRLGKRKKTVTWAPDGKLESIRLIERAIYGDENTEGGEYSSHSVRDLDRSEGAALHMHLFEETVDWSEPLRGSQSQEKATQEQREQTALVSLYMSPSSIPDSPAEPSSVITDEEVDKDVREMTAGPEVDAVFWSGPPIPPVEVPQPGVPPLSSVADLVGQLAGGVDGARANANANAMSVDPVMQALPPEQLQHLLAQLSQLPTTQQPLQQQQQPQQMHMQMPHQQQQQQAPYGDWPGLNQFSADYSQSGFNQDDHGGPGDRNGWPGNRGGGRGRGRGRGRGGGGDDGGYRHGNKKRLCNFFAAGRCKYGDQCDYSHDMY